MSFHDRTFEGPFSPKPVVPACGYLLQGKPCLTSDCDSSHDLSLIGAWQKQFRKNSKTLCRHGENCFYNQDGKCFFWHPPADRQARTAAVLCGLEYLETLDLDTLAVDQDVCIEDESDLASFNKLSKDEIIVPGSPPFLHPLTRCTEVKSDTHNPDVNTGFHKYEHAFEPLLQSVRVMNPRLNIFDIAEVVSNASNLRKLFHFFKNGHHLTERYDLEWRRGALFISKWFDDPSLQSSMGYGASFEKVTCRYDSRLDHPLLRISTSHHRVVRYKFAGIDCVVQSEVDAYCCGCNHQGIVPQTETLSKHQHQHQHQANQVGVPDGFITPSRKGRRPSVSSTSSSYKARNQRNRAGSNASSLSSSPTFNFRALAIDDPGHSPNLPSAKESTTLKVHHLGRHVPSKCLVEVKTCREGVQPSFTPEAQLYFSRRTKLYTAKHRGGVFSPDQGRAILEDKDADLKKWEATHQAALGKIGALLRMLWRRVRDLDGRGVEGVSLVISGDGAGPDGTVKAELYTGEGRRLLPAVV
ncbi:hypothetical protein OQA88_5868 [Cercophora sp. LCS_1]